jgi:hypothetical protein
MAEHVSGNGSPPQGGKPSVKHTKPVKSQPLTPSGKSETLASSVKSEPPTSSVKPETLTSSVKSDSQSIVEALVLFCEKHGVDINQYDSAMKLCVLLSLGGVDVQGLCKGIIPDVFVDWTNVAPGLLVFGNNTVAWIDAMQFFTLGQVLASQQNTTACRIPSVIATFTKLL